MTDRLEAMDEAECEKAIQEISKQCKAKEPEYPMLRSNQQLVLRSVGGQTRERKRAAWRSINVSWRQRRNGGSHSQVKKDTKEKSGGANNHRRAHCSQCSLSPLDRSTSSSKPFLKTLSHTSERISQQAQRVYKPPPHFPFLSQTLSSHVCTIVLWPPCSCTLFLLLWVTLLCPPASFFW